MLPKVLIALQTFTKGCKMVKRVLLYLLALHILNASSVDFHREFVGVQFLPYVKQVTSSNSLEITSGFKSYSFENVKAMLTVVSQKFSKVFVSDVYSMHEWHIRNFTYYNGSRASVYSGEAAAMINLENKKKLVTIIYNILPSEINKDLFLLFEAVEKANKIFPGTVEGIGFGIPQDMKDMKRILHVLRAYSKKASQLKIKLGATLKCLQFFYFNNNEWFKEQKEIVIRSDFVTCDTRPVPLYQHLGPVPAFNMISKGMIACKEFFQQIGADAQIFYTTRWPSSGNEKWETADNQRMFWRIVNNWTFKNNHTIYLAEAFDNPWKNNKFSPSVADAHLGWWKLSENSKINFIDGYVEKNILGGKWKNASHMPVLATDTDDNGEISTRNVSSPAVQVSKKRSSKEFNQTFFGVGYQPFVKSFNTAVEYEASFEFYTKQNVETMLTVVASKFRRVLVFDPFASFVRYTYNFTYYHGSRVNTYSGEVAARINRKNKNNSLSLLYNVMQSDFEAGDTGILVALEAAERANKIFSGTVSAVGITRKTHRADSKLLQYLRDHRTRATERGLKLGVGLVCADLFEPKNHTEKTTQTQVLTESEFVICVTGADNKKVGPANSFYSLSNQLLEYRDYIHTFNQKAEVIITLFGWSSSGTEEWETVGNLQIFWKTASKWADENKFMIYMVGAFDIPYLKSSSGESVKMGWWSLEDNSKIDMLEGYVEKTAGIDASLLHNEDEIKVEENHIPALKWSRGIILTSVAGAGMTFCFLFLLVLLCKKKKRMLLSVKEVRDFLLGTSNDTDLGAGATVLDSALAVPYAQTLEIPKDRFKIDEKCILGSGQFGFVTKALLQVDDGVITEVALKVSKGNCQSAGLKGLLSEIKIMTYLGKHPNIVSLEGAYTAELATGIVYVATELCSLGSLQSFLRGKHFAEGDENRDPDPMSMENAEQEMVMLSNSHVSLQDMLRWSYEIACGMEFLEGKHVVHADIAARNILLTSEKTAKIADFGLSRRMYNYKNYKKEGKEPLPWRWMGVESLQKMVFSSKSDVWSYGVTLWEIFSKGATPYPGLVWTQDFVDELINGLRPNCPSFAPAEIYEIMQKCWTLEPSERPNFCQLVGCVNNLILKSS